MRHECTKSTKEDTKKTGTLVSNFKVLAPGKRGESSRVSSMSGNPSHSEDFRGDDDDGQKCQTSAFLLFVSSFVSSFVLFVLFVPWCRNPT